MTPLKYAGLVAGLVILAFAGVPAFAQMDGQMGPDFRGTMTFTVTDNGIQAPELTALRGLYVVTVRNDSSVPRGIVMTGIDKCCAPFVRYSEILAPGQEYSFRWYFPENRSVLVRDLLQCRPVARTCGAPVIGPFSETVVVA